MALTCFKAYDIRGRLGDELNVNVAYRIGRAYAQYLNARRVVVGGDVRATSNELKEALAQGMMDAGCDVVDLGMTGTEQVYFASFHLDVDGGIEVTASHNPIDFNGMKLVRRNAQPISGDTGLKDIKALAESGNFAEPERKGECTEPENLEAFCGGLDRALARSTAAGINRVAREYAEKNLNKEAILGRFLSDMAELTDSRTK